MRRLLRDVPVLTLGPGYFERVGALRARLLARRLRAGLSTALIAQSCLDHGAALVARDPDFRHVACWAGLKLVAT